MAITVGTDTYISLVDADTYVAAHYASSDAKYMAWTALTDADCEVYLRRAALIIDRQPIVGVRAVETQTMAFPRAIYSTYTGGLDWGTISLDYSGSWYLQSSVPSAVTYAQVEIALQECVGVPARAAAQRDGVTSITLGKIHETYAMGVKTQDISSYEARQLLKPYIAGSVGIA